MRHKRFHRGQAGFSLVEIMVALVIGLLTTLVIMQVFTVFEGQKRSTMGSADAQTSGSVALYMIERDMQMAGFGLLPATDSALECNPSPVIAAGVDLSPVVITDGGAAAGASDTVAIRYGNTPTAGIPSTITSVVGSTAIVDVNIGCQVNDVAVAINGAACVATTVTGLSTPPDYTGVQLASTAGVVPGANLACLGQWNQITYQVVNGNLEVNSVPTVAGVVNLQAQYGISAVASSNQVIQWVDATAASGWAAPSVANRNRIKAIRVAIVARNEQLEKDPVSTTCTSTTAAAPTGLCAWDATSGLPSPLVPPFIASPAPTIDLSNDADWARYRYRVFETIIPLRNLIWAWETL
ncbi:MAG: PilW family protein [Propionivibrio sp.]|nr:PilW family protein [Propionivibrio sp.]